MEIEINIHPKQHTAYLPKPLRKILGNKVTATANRKAVLLYNKQTPINQIRRSVEIILADLKHAEQIEKEGCFFSP